jgi:hypothetical protein
MRSKPLTGNPLAGALMCGMLLFALSAVGRAEVVLPQAISTAELPLRLEGSGSALTRLARAVSKVEVNEPSLVVVGPVAGAQGNGLDSMSEAGLSELRGRIATTVASVIVLSAQREAEPLSPELARRKARDLRLPLVYLAPGLRGGNLSLRITVDKWPRGLWQRAMHPIGLRTASASFEVAADSSVRSLFPAARISAARATRLPLPLPDPLALACGDMGDAGERWLAVVNRQEVALATLKGESVATQERRPWTSLAEISGTPLRDPLAAAHFERDALLVGISDRAALVTLNQGFSRTSYGRRLYPLGQGLCTEFSATGLLPNPMPCPVAEPKPPEKQIPPEADSGKGRDVFARHTFALPSGTVQTVTVDLGHRTKRAALSISSASDQTQQLFVEDAGDVILVADLDGDGSVEVVSSSASEGSSDSLRIHSIKGSKVSLIRSFAIGEVHALSVCPFSGRNPLTLIAAAGNALWTIH